MDKIMNVYIASPNKPDSEACATLVLPAMPYELFDALDKVRIGLDDELYFQVEEYCAFEYLEPYLTDADNLSELNALCQRLSELDDLQCAAFEGLLKMEIAKKSGPIPIGTCIDLAYSTDSCNVVGEARNDAELGRFYANNDFIPTVENLSDEVFELLDFEKIGRTQRTAEGGVFTRVGYVMQDTELTEAYKNMSFTVQTPDYQILLELPDGMRLELPCKFPPDVPSHRCLDCRVPMLMGAIDEADIQEVNEFAEMLKGVGDTPMRKYKAVLYATGCDSLENAIATAEHLDDFKFEESTSCMRELALDKLNSLLDAEEVELLSKYTDLYCYGKAVMERDNSAITQYGLLGRRDWQPVETMNNQPERSGMEMI